MSTIPLPEEIQQNIIDYFRASPTVLLTLSLVSRGWLIRARYLFFTRYQVLLKTRPPADDGASSRKDYFHYFLELLRAPHSTLGSFVQDIYVVGPDELYYDSDKINRTEQAYEVLHDLIVNHLPRLSNLRKFVLQGVTWNLVKPEARPVIGSLPVTFLTFAMTMFKDYTQFTSLLEICGANERNLEGLRIHYPRFMTEPTPQDLESTTTFNKFRRLRYLDLELYNTVLPLLSLSQASYLQPQKIETLILHYASMRNAALIGTFISTIGPALRHLALDITQADYLAELVASGQSFPISLGQNQHLRALDISTIWLNKRISYDSTPLLALISTIDSQLFDKLTLWFRMDEVESLQSFDFESFEKCLTRKAGRRPSLQLNFLRSIDWEWAIESGEHARIVDVLEKRLPTLHARERLIVDPGEPHKQRLYGDWEKWSPENREWLLGCEW